MATNECSPPLGTRLYPGRCWQHCRVAHKRTADKCKFSRLLGSQPIQGGNLAFYWKHTVHIPQSPGISLRKDRKKDQSPRRHMVLQQFCGFLKQESNPTFWRRSQLCRLNEPGCSPPLLIYFKPFLWNSLRKIDWERLWLFFYSVELDCRFFFTLWKICENYNTKDERNYGISSLIAWSACSRKFD